MATTTRRPLPLKVKKLPPPRLPSPEKSTTNKTKNGRDLDPLERRLISIRLHLLHNTTRRQQTPSEPTLVFDSFLYLGGLKSLSNKVYFNSNFFKKNIFVLFINRFVFHVLKSLIFFPLFSFHLQKILLHHLLNIFS